MRRSATAQHYYACRKRSQGRGANEGALMELIPFEEQTELKTRLVIKAESFS